MEKATLLEALREGLPAPRGDDEPAAELEAKLEALLSEAQTRWPDVALAPELFLRYVAARLPEEATLGEALGRVSVDLYLACACARGDGRAVAALESEALSGLADALERRDIPRDVADEAVQRTRVKLLASDPWPRIGEYRGAGDLRGWLKVVALREALMILRRAKHEAPGGDLADEDWAPRADAELALLEHAHRGDFKDAIRDALAELTARERNVLRQKFMLGFSIDRIGAIYKIDRVTASRWSHRALEKLLDGTRRRLMKRLALRPTELDSLIRVLRSQLDVSLEKLLGPVEPNGPAK